MKPNPLVINPLMFHDCDGVSQIVAVACEFAIDTAPHLNDDPASPGYRPEWLRRLANTTMVAIFDDIDRQRQKKNTPRSERERQLEAWVSAGMGY
ncbi:hypothetical protein [Mycolicibacter kumamotonensis]|uniref:Uncharacterized protein n=1 Tax=Mycolicibacter kumamotonensis TaxID=354243 RepID=A0A1B8SKZ2_9MYCO|nr:hypothetical protein [Mycolicibacter kumamotonensis]OBY33419.1 hypothetical protein ACT18_00185 [Mycolicibacter kumamotonensis]